MKTLLIIRHAKSSWESNLTDFERPLNERGKKDAPIMAQRLLDRKISIDTFISSPAKRAKQTA
jgi:phosphohistidine phosphatase